MPIRGKNRTEETFGVDTKNPTLKKGRIEVVGHAARSTVDTTRGYSPNQKTGHPVAAEDKK